MNQTERQAFKQWFRENYADKVMVAKGSEYSGTGRGDTDDINGNFKRVAGLVGLDPLQVAMVYALKHLDSILTYIKTGKEGTEPIYGRFGDLYNYVEIMASLVGESQIQEPSPWLADIVKDAQDWHPVPMWPGSEKLCADTQCDAVTHYEKEALTVD